MDARDRAVEAATKGTAPIMSVSWTDEEIAAGVLDAAVPVLLDEIEKRLTALHQNSGKGANWDLCDECDQPWSSGAGSLAAGCSTIRELSRFRAEWEQR